MSHVKTNTKKDKSFYVIYVYKGIKILIKLRGF